MSFVFATSIASNYLAKAMALCESIKSHMPSAKFVVWLLEREIPDAARQFSAFDEVIRVADGVDYNLDYFIFRHQITEACTAVKGDLFRYLFRKYTDRDKFVYLDPDTFAYSPFLELDSLLDSHEIVLTPHLLRNTGHLAMEISVLEHGVYNLGFLALRRSKVAEEFLDWWTNRLHVACFDLKYIGLFTDQKWINLAPFFFDVFELRHPGYNVGPWSLRSRGFTRNGDREIRVAAAALRFIHFSGYPDIFSSCIEMWLSEGKDILKTLLQEYGTKLKKLGDADFTAIPWSYSTYRSGRRISLAARQEWAFREHTGQDNPFALSDIRILGFRSVFRILSARLNARVLASLYRAAQARLRTWTLYLPTGEERPTLSAEEDLPIQEKSFGGHGMINWHNRYAKMLKLNSELFNPEKSILEVGSGLQGISLWLQRPVVGVEPEWSGTPNSWLTLVSGDIRNLPFDSNSFDIVVCTDVFEHLRPSDRTLALSELIRVAREKVLISCPCGQASLQAEREFERTLQRLTIPTPTWLEEHFQNGLPSVGSMVTDLLETGMTFSIAGNESRLQHYGGLLLEYFMPSAIRWHAIHAWKNAQESPIGEAEWDLYYSFLFTVSKSRRRYFSSKFEAIEIPSASTTSSALYAVVHRPDLISDLGDIRYLYSAKALRAAKAGDVPPGVLDAEHLENSRWSELSGIYTVWKDGPVTDVVGFCHYRRLFNFKPNGGVERQRLIEPSETKSVKDSFSFPPALLERIRKGLVVVARPVDLGSTIFDHYEAAHNANHYFAMLQGVMECAPDLLPYFERSFTDTSMYCNNMFAMNWPMFDQFCSIWFPILQATASRIRWDSVSSYQCRDISFLSERLFDMIIKWLKHRGVEVEEYPVYQVNYPSNEATSLDAINREIYRDGDYQIQGFKALQDQLDSIKRSRSWRAVRFLKNRMLFKLAFRLARLPFRLARRLHLRG